MEKAALKIVLDENDKGGKVVDTYNINIKYNTVTYFLRLLDILYISIHLIRYNFI